MGIIRQPRTKIVFIALLGVLPLLAACGGGGGSGGNGGSGSGGKNNAATQKTYQIRQCTTYRKTDGLTGISFWASCEDYTWEPRPDEPLFNNLEACEERIRVLKDTDSFVYDNSDDDKARRWARKLFCVEPDTTPPTLVSRSPAADSSDFPISGSSVRAVFSENMDPASFDSTTFTLEGPTGTLVLGVVVYYKPTREARFTSDEPLNYLTTYTARLSTGIADNSGNALRAEHSWPFTTKDNVPVVSPDDKAPSVITQSPKTNSICAAQDSTVSVRFDEAISTFGAFTLSDSSGAPVDGTVTFGVNMATYTPALPLDFNAIYTAHIAGDIADEAGNTITLPDWSFRTELTPEGSWTQIATPEDMVGRSEHTAIWTGSEMIVWGGGHAVLNTSFPYFQYATDHGRYDPAQDTWDSVSTVNAPENRRRHSATWTGTEMIVWGGTSDRCPSQDCLFSTNTGGRYNPTTDTWVPMSTDGAPSPRTSHSVVWTGTELIIWGGLHGGGLEEYNTELSDGARYDPATDTWSPLSIINAPAARRDHEAFFDGQQMIVWGGNGSATDGSIYDPASDVWSVLPGDNAPSGGATNSSSVVSSGTDMFVWMTAREWIYDQVVGEWYDSYTSQTRRYNYQDQQWNTVIDACSPAATPTAVWLNGRLLSWSDDITKGQSYDEQLDTWIPITPFQGGARSGATVVVVGDSVIVWGGRKLNTGYRLTF